MKSTPAPCLKLKPKMPPQILQLQKVRMADVFFLKNNKINPVSNNKIGFCGNIKYLPKKIFAKKMYFHCSLRSKGI
jgi:hypothetical protein